MLEWKDFKEQDDHIIINNSEWKKMNVKCPKCGEPIYKNMTIVLTSYPPQYEYRCLNCDWYDFAYH